MHQDGVQRGWNVSRTLNLIGYIIIPGDKFFSSQHLAIMLSALSMTQQQGWGI